LRIHVFETFVRLRPLLFRRFGKTVVNNGGVLRGIDNLGVRHLAYTMTRHQSVATVGRYVVQLLFSITASFFLVGFLLLHFHLQGFSRFFVRMRPLSSQLRPPAR
jgi:hypothetical protein